MVPTCHTGGIGVMSMWSNRQRPDSPHALDTVRDLTPPVIPSDHTPSAAESMMEQLLAEIERDFARRTDLDSLLAMSKQCQAEMREHLVICDQRMLPTFHYDLPNGQEQGLYLTLEVGGSNLRMAMVEFAGRHEERNSMRIHRITTIPISLEVKMLVGHGFFGWMAERISEMLVEEGEIERDAKPLRMGVAWSFPVEQRSMRSGAMLGMGKGFRCSEQVRGHDLGAMIQEACNRANLPIHLSAILNDSTSTLLAHAYLDPSTRLAIILGTGINAAIQIPLASLSLPKFHPRVFPPGLPRPSHVVTNTEFSMFGKAIFPTTRWDEVLNREHLVPDYQPLEYLIAGGYMSEIVRLVMGEAAETVGFWGGELPAGLREGYSLDSMTLAVVDSDSSVLRQVSRQVLQEEYGAQTGMSVDDAAFIAGVVRAVTGRSVAFFAAGVHALTSLVEALDEEWELKVGETRKKEEKEEEDGGEDEGKGESHFSIGCDGSIINKYPRYMERAQVILDKLWAVEYGGNGMEGKGEGKVMKVKRRKKKKVVLAKTRDSAVLGAGVAAALAREGKEGPMMNGV